MSRPRKYADDAERKRAYRRRKGIRARRGFRPVGNAPIDIEKKAPKSRSAIQRAYRDRKRGFKSHRIKGALPVPNSENCNNCTDEYVCGACRHAWNKYLCSVGLPAPRADNFYITGAPQGCGRFVTGGYDGEKLSAVSAAHEKAESGRKVKGANFVERQLNGKFIYRQSGGDPNPDDDAEAIAYQEQLAEEHYVAEQKEFDRSYKAAYKELKSRKSKQDEDQDKNDNSDGTRDVEQR